MTPIEQEFDYRRHLWEQLLKDGGAKNVSPSTLHELLIYGGAQGVWVNKSRTGALTQNEYGVTVSLTHTGKSYPDDWSEDGVIYHYPQTRRPPGRDLSEIEATKNASRLGLPVFVVTHTRQSKRDVYLGWVEAWDDKLQQFLVVFDKQFSEKQTYKAIALEDAEGYEPFTLFSHQKSSVRLTSERPNQQRFKFQVFKRYGPACTVCGHAIAALLQAAHIVPKEQRGSDDPRNGLVFCANHHLAFDMDFFSIHPETLAICYTDEYDKDKLQINYESLSYLAHHPHREALQWRYNHWCQVTNTQ